MGAYVTRRLATTALLALVVVTLIFSAIHLVPGDPAETLLSGPGGAPPSAATIQAMRHRLHLDEPLPEQYWSYLSGLARLNLGASFQDGRPVLGDIEQRLPRTLELILAAMVLACAIGVPLGTLAALRRGEAIDTAVSLFVSAGLSIPVFVLATLLVWLFAVKLGWAPAGGFVDFTESPPQNLGALVLPAVSLSLSVAAAVTRMSRSATLEVKSQDWVRTARAKGLGGLRLIVKHIVRNSLGPVVTVVGLNVGALLGGTVLVEYVFNWPGLSSLLVQAVQQRDYPEVQGIVLVISILFVLLNLLVDLTYSALDPRVTHG